MIDIKKEGNMEIKISELKAKIEEIYEEKKAGDGWDAWSALCAWIAQVENAQQWRETWGPQDWFWVCGRCEQKNGKEYDTCWKCGQHRRIVGGST